MKLAGLFVAALASVAGSTAPPEEIRFAPVDDLALVKTFGVVSAMESETSSEHGSSSSSSTTERHLVVTDRIRTTEDDRILQLERTYDEVASQSEGSAEFGDNSNEFSTTGTSEVEGATVVFEWDEDDEEYLADSDELDGEVLEELAFDLDFTVLLPEGGGEVEEGDEWTLTPDDYRTLMDPWSGLPWDWERSDGETFSSSHEDTDAPLPETEESEEGELVVTFAGVRDEDGVAVAVLALEGEIDSESTSVMTGEFDQGTSTMHSETSETRSIEGEALWDLEAGHLLSIRVEVELSSNGTSQSSMVFGDQEFESESEHESGGTITFTASFAAEDR